MAGDTPRVMAAEFAVARQLNPRLKKAVYHSSLSLPKTEHLDDDTWCAIADEYIEGMEFNDSQYVVYRHSDKDHDHIHIVASRIRITDGTTVNDSWDYVRSEKLIRELEQKYELTPTISSHQKQQRGKTTGEMRLIERTGTESIRAKLQQVIDTETSSPITMPELVNRLKDKGIDAKITLTRTGKIKGISYQFEGVATSGTHLGKAYTFLGLQKHRCVSYDHNLQYQELIKASNREPVIKTAEEKKREQIQLIKLAQTQQRERSLRIAPILTDCVHAFAQTELEAENYRLSLLKPEQTLYLYHKDEAEPRLKIKYRNQKFELIEPPLTKDNKPALEHSDVEYWQLVAIRLRQAIEEKRRQLEKQRQQSKKRTRGTDLSL